MAGLVFACIAPHGSMIIPPLAGEKGQKALATRAAIEELGRRMAASQPETVVLGNYSGLLPTCQRRGNQVK